MERVSVSSSNLSSVGYDKSTETLEIEFRNGAVYQYMGVPQETFQGLMSSKSVGKTFHSDIRDRFSFKRV